MAADCAGAVFGRERLGVEGYGRRWRAMTQPTRTKEQVAADAFDCDLFRLLMKTEWAAEEAKSETSAGRWQAIAQALRQARPFIREMMHPADRAKTL